MQVRTKPHSDIHDHLLGLVARTCHLSITCSFVLE